MYHSSSPTSSIENYLWSENCEEKPMFSEERSLCELNSQEPDEPESEFHTLDTVRVYHDYDMPTPDSDSQMPFSIDYDIFEQAEYQVDKTVPEMYSNVKVAIKSVHRYQLNMDPITHIGTHGTVILGNSALWRSKERKPNQDFFTKRVDGDPRNFSPILVYAFDNLIPDKMYQVGIKLARKSIEPINFSEKKKKKKKKGGKKRTPMKKLEKIPLFSEELFSRHTTGTDLMENVMCWNKLKVSRKESATRPQPLLVHSRFKYNVVLTIYEIEQDTRQVLEVVEFKETMFRPISSRWDRKDRKKQ